MSWVKIKSAPFSSNTAKNVPPRKHILNFSERKFGVSVDFDASDAPLSNLFGGAVRVSIIGLIMFLLRGVAHELFIWKGGLLPARVLLREQTSFEFNLAILLLLLRIDLLFLFLFILCFNFLILCLNFFFVFSDLVLTFIHLSFGGSFHGWNWLPATWLSLVAVDDFFFGGGRLFIIPQHNLGHCGDGHFDHVSLHLWIFSTRRAHSWLALLPFVTNFDNDRLGTVLNGSLSFARHSNFLLFLLLCSSFWGLNFLCGSFWLFNNLLLFYLSSSSARSWLLNWRFSLHCLPQLLFPNLNVTEGGRRQRSPLEIGSLGVWLDEPSRYALSLLLHLNERVAGHFGHDFFFGCVFWIFLSQFVGQQGSQALPVIFKEPILTV